MEPQQLNSYTNIDIPASADRRPKYILAACTVIALLFAYQIVHAVLLSQSTGIVTASSTVSAATLTVTKDNYLEATVGTGTSRFRLQPGTYTVTASAGDRTASKTISVTKHKTINVSLTPVAASVPKSSTSNTAPSSTTQAEDNALVRHLPFTGAALSYEITYAFTGPNKSNLVITITAPTTNGQQLATQWLKGLGYNPSNLDIQYFYGPVED